MYGLTRSEAILLGVGAAFLLSSIFLPSFCEYLNPVRIEITPTGIMPAADLSAPPRIDINTALPEELADLIGVGPLLAARIVEHRRENGRFGSVDELRNVKGVGPALIGRIRERISVE